MITFKYEVAKLHFRHNIEYLFHSQKDYFYGYILYAINRFRSDRIFEQNRAFFKQRQNDIEDKLGLNSFLVQPIQRLPKYKLLLTQLISELGKNLEEDGVKVQIAACCKAEKRLQRLLDTVNESMNINDIVDCHEVKLKFITFIDQCVFIVRIA